MPDVRDAEVLLSLVVGLLAGPERQPNGYEQYGVTHLVLVMARVLGPRHLDAYAEMLRDEPRNPTDGEFDTLPADAGEDARQDLAERMAPHIRRIRAEHPELVDPAPGGARSATRVVAAAMRELYDPAQVDVLRRVRHLPRADARPTDSREDGT